jgi:hypothetical protein
LNSAAKKAVAGTTGARDATEARETLWPADFIADGIECTIHAFAGASAHARRIPAVKELFLWRLRNEWQLVSAMKGRDWLTLPERKRVTSHRNPAAGRQFGIGRAALRMVMSRMPCCEPHEVMLEDTPGGGVRITNTPRNTLLNTRDDPAGRTIAVDLVHAGMSMVIALSIGHVALGVMGPLIGHAGQSAPERKPFSPKNAQQDSRAISLVRAPETLGAPLACNAWAQTLNIPMPGDPRGAVTCDHPVTAVTAFGWRH